MTMLTTADRAAITIFQRHQGLLRASAALQLGIHPRTLYGLRDAGTLEQLGRGLYRLADLPPLSNPDLVIVATRYPQAVICLISALAFHELTTQVPHRVDVAIHNQAAQPTLDQPPLRVFRFSGRAWTEGVTTYPIDGVAVRITNLEKSIADAFKYRNKIGLDIALEALKEYWARRDFDRDRLLKYARICRVERVLRPYLKILQ
jgi:predicted transcriptional regulator of viral defense system